MKKSIFVAFAMIAMTFASCINNGKTIKVVENDSILVDSVMVDSIVVIDSIAVDTIVAE